MLTLPWRVTNAFDKFRCFVATNSGIQERQTRANEVSVTLIARPTATREDGFMLTVIELWCHHSEVHAVPEREFRSDCRELKAQGF
jgi:hypothetical protein